MAGEHAQLLLDALRTYAMAMPAGPYEVTDVSYDTTGDAEHLHLPAQPIDPHPHPNITIYPACEPMTEPHHAEYFAALDRDVVLVLVAMAADYLRAYERGWVSGTFAMGTLWALAADRMAQRGTHDVG